MEQTSRVRFLGAASTVTGSKTLFEHGKKKILVDCGLFQGLKELRELNWKPFPVAPGSITEIILTHAHLDHIGYLPKLVKNGFRGRIYCTAPTFDLAKLILLDSAKIQVEDAVYANRKGFSKHKPAYPLYNEEDVRHCLTYFSPQKDSKWIKINNDISFRFKRNGHIVGSAVVEIATFQNKLVFSGDLGREESLIQLPAEPCDEADYVVLESTYGDRLHPKEPSDEVFADIINNALQKGGHILIPAFALERSQELLLLINQLKKKKKIPDIPVFLDSPMAVEATEIMFRYSKWTKVTQGEIQEIMEWTRFIKNIEVSLEVSRSDKQKIVIASSGMATGGRVMVYLKAWLEGSKNTIILCGYQAPGTRGRTLKEGGKQLKIHGKIYAVKAQVQEFHFLSGHTDAEGLVNWLGNIKNKPKMVYLNHGEKASAMALARKIESTLGLKCTVPEYQQSFDLEVGATVEA